MIFLRQLIELCHRDSEVALSGVRFLVLVELDLQVAGEWKELIVFTEGLGLVALGHEMVVGGIIGFDSKLVILVLEVIGLDFEDSDHQYSLRHYPKYKISAGKSCIKLKQIRSEDIDKINNKIQQAKKYNLLMKKLSETYFKQVQTKPSRTQSPDFKAGNAIRPTRSPQNIEYILKQNERQRTPVKAWQTPQKNQHKTITSTSRYFINNRSTTNDQRSPFHNTISSEGHGRGQANYCALCREGHCHCSNNQEVVIELKKIITMINGAAVPAFEAGDENARQVEVLKLENGRLLDLVEKYKARAETKYESVPLNTHAHESEIKILRQQLNHAIGQHEKQRQQLYRTNKTLSSQYKSLQDKCLTYEKQLQKLRQQLKSKQQQLLLDQESRKKGQDRLSLSMIKQQYSTSIKTLKDNVQFQIDNQTREHQARINQYRMRIDNLEDRLRACEKVNGINRILNQENEKLHRKLDERISTGGSQLSPGNDKLARENFDLSQEIKVLKRQNSESRLKYETQIAEMKNSHSSAEQNLIKDTEARVKKLMQNYQQEIKILKNEAKSKTCPHKGIEQQNQMLKQQNEQNWQQVIKLRNELAKYTAENSRLQSEVGKLTHQVGNDQLNLTARTTLLENQNNRLRKELEDKLEISRSLAQLENENSRLKQDLAMKSSNITNLTALEFEKQELKSDLEHSRLKCQQLEQENRSKYYEIDRMNSELSKRELELRQNFKHQLDQTRTLYESQISQLQAQNKKLQQQYDGLKIQFTKLQLEMENMLHTSGRAKDEKIYEHELTIRNLGRIVEETEDKVGQLQDNLKRRTDENEKLVRELGRMEETAARNLRDNDDNWQKEVDRLKADHLAQINKLKQQVIEKQHEEETNIMKIKTKISTFSTEGLKRELLELKKLVDEARFERLEEELSRISEIYERELIRSEQKTMEIDGLIKDKCILEDRIGDLERMRLVLQEKINILEGNTKILQNELKDRKALCDSLLNQKVILQKQNLMLKKVKIDKESIEATKAKARQISNKIDKLLALEEQRENNMMEVSKTYSEMMVESKTRRI